MNADSYNGDAVRPLILPMRFPDFEVSWAGHCPLNDEFCFGSEDGKLLFTTQDGKTEFIIEETTPSHEAINGVAFLNESVAVSTRCDITVLKNISKPSERTRAVIEHGTHGIIATSSGYFVAPLGKMGLWQMEKRNVISPITIINTSEPVYFYQIVSIRVAEADIIVCAARGAGVVAVPLDWETRQLSSISFPDLDMVDVCTLRQGPDSAAVAAVAKDNTLILFRDILNEQVSPVTISFNGIQGIAYRLLSSKGHLFLLTSKALYVLAGLAQGFLEGEDVSHQPTPVRAIPLEAVDANLAGDRWLLVVMPDQVLRIDVDLLVGCPPAVSSLGTGWEAYPTCLTPEWIRSQDTKIEIVAA